MVFKNGQSHQKQGKSEKLSLLREAYRDMTTKCNVVSGSILYQKKDVRENYGNLNIVMALIMIHQPYFITREVGLGIWEIYVLFL